jgi:hypothetical protein
MELLERDPSLIALLSSRDEAKELWDVESPSVSSWVRSTSPSFPFVGGIEPFFQNGCLMAIVNILSQVRAVKIEEFLRGRVRLRFGPFFEILEVILEPCHPFKGLESLLMLLQRLQAILVPG